MAIGLQAVDGLKVSGYLLELARRNIEGEISMEDVNKLIDEYYEEKHRIRDTWKEYETIQRLMFIQTPKAVKGGGQYKGQVKQNGINALYERWIRRIN